MSLLYLEFTLPLKMMFLKSSTGGVWNSNGVTHCYKGVSAVAAVSNVVYIDQGSQMVARRPNLAR